MEVVVLCGGRGIRMYPATEHMPKPLIEVGGKPILWHIMNQYSKHGHNDFILLLGFKGEMIRDYFSKKENIAPEWNITFLDTGLESRKGDRIRMAKDSIKGDKFLLAYGDDLCDVDINSVIKMHEENSKKVTFTGVRLVSNFGVLEMDENNVIRGFKEKPVLDHWISGGYLVMNKEVIDSIKPGMDETDAFDVLSKEGQVQAYKHEGFWKTMNTIKDVQELNDMWNNGNLQKYISKEKS